MLQALPGGMVADKSSTFGLQGLQQCANIASFGKIAPITTSGTASVMTLAQLLTGVILLNAGASGGFTLTLPSTASILGAFAGCAPLDGSFSKLILINNSVGTHTATLTAGDASTTVTGTATIADQFVRCYIMNVPTATTVTFTSFGVMAV